MKSREAFFYWLTITIKLSERFLSGLAILLNIKYSLESKYGHCYHE